MPKTQEKIDLITEFMEKGKEYKMVQFSEIINLKESRTREIINIMVSQGIIDIMGDNKNRWYILK